MMSMLLLCCTLFAAGAGDPQPVVVYTALDRGFSEPILEAFERSTGIDVRVVYDAEATKTIGLVNRIRAEKNRPRCDVFWNNEIVNTIRLKQEGLLQACNPSEAANYPRQFKDPDGFWYGFAARARVLIVNTKLVEPGAEPKSIFDLTDAKWKNKVGIAKPLFGTTASHVACLFASLGEKRAAKWLADIKANDVQILSGNRGCAQAVGRGELHCALTDTDDAMLEIAAGSPVKIVYLDTDSTQIGTLFIPNTLSVVKDCPNPEGAEKLIDYLLSVEVETTLSNGPSAQIPLNTKFAGQARVKTPRQIKPMTVDFAEAARQFKQAAKYIEEHFLN